MRRQRGLVGLTGLAALVGLGVIAKPAMSAVTTEKSASILVFPKVIANGTRDTIIQITNTSNSVQHAHCFYVDGEIQSNRPLCQETDFDIWLTKQQPTHWVVSTGRLMNPSDSHCAATVACDPDTTGTVDANCCDAGFDPGHVPPVSAHFQGELFCVLTDSGDAPYPGNAIKGEATIEDLATGDVSKYNGYGLIGYNTNNADSTLCLGPADASSAACPSREYEGCPATWFLDHAANGGLDAVEADDTEGTCSISGSVCRSATDCPTGQSCLPDRIYSIQPNLTVVPCTINLETQAQTAVTLQFQIINEFESKLSASTTVSCWASWNLGASSNGVSDAFNWATAGSPLLQTRMRAASPTSQQANGGVLAVVEETHSAYISGVVPTLIGTATSAQDGHTSFADEGLDVITIPADQFQPPVQ